MNKTSKFEELREEVDRLVQLKGKDNWSETRSEHSFHLVERHYSFGTRQCYQRKSNDDPTYIDLQSSRGLSIHEDDTLENVMSQLDKVMALDDADAVRAEEIEKLWDTLETKLGKIQHTGFVELGFRVPRLMKHYSKKYGVKGWGFDIAPLSIGVTQKLGYDGRVYDFNKCTEDLDLNGASLIVSYHMLEHLSDPLVAVKKIYEAMDEGAFFHVEIPVEPGKPRLQFAHMFPFHQHDMAHMLQESGFVILALSNKTHEGGPWVERYMVQK